MKHMLQDEQSRHKCMDAFGFQPQNEVTGFLFAAAKERAKTVELLGGHAAAIVRDSAIMPCQFERGACRTADADGEIAPAPGEPRPTLLDLLRRLDAVEGIDRYRISSIEPDLLSHEIIEWVARQSRAFMPHFHIPLQCGSDAVLRLMGRRYDTALFADRIRMINDLLPDAFIGVDVIAGARGETPERWRESYGFIESLGITRLHVFPYSERPGTRALGLPDAVPVAERHRRVHDLTALSDARLQAFSEGQLGRVRPVLWERYRGNTLNGLTDNYLRVEAPVPGGMDPESFTNTITNVRLTAVDGETMTGEHVG